MKRNMFFQESVLSPIRHVFSDRSALCLYSVTWMGVMSCVPCLRHGIPVWQHIGQGTTATIRHRRDMTSDALKRGYIQTNKQTILKEKVTRTGVSYLKNYI